MTTVGETAVRVGELAAEAVSNVMGEEEAAMPREGGGIARVGRMAGVMLLNDGGTGGWLPTDRHGVRLAHDGEVWAVTYLDPNAWWHRKHAYRLSTDELPLRDGTTLKLEPGAVYEIRHADREYRDVWDLFQTTRS